MELQIKILIAVSLILIGCTTFQPKEEVPLKTESIYSNDFSTEEIRSFWALCQKAFLAKNPYTPPPVLIGHCDCYSDYVRRTYKSAKELNNLAIYDNLTKNLITECNFKLSFPDPA